MTDDGDFEYLIVDSTIIRAHQSQKRRNAVLQLPNRSGRSRYGLPVRAIHSTASGNSRLFLHYARGRRLAQTMRLDHRTLGIRQNVSIHPQCESHTRLLVNPHRPLGFKPNQRVELKRFF